MHEQPRVIRFVSFGPDGAQRAVRFAASQPSWVTRFAVMAFLIVIGIPILLLILLATIAGAVVFTVLALVAAGLARLRNLGSGRSEGRENVRVIQRR